MGVGFLFQALALHDGALSVVQPLITTEMLFVVLILWAWYGFHVRGRDWVFAALTVGGLAVFLVELAPTSAGHAPSNRTWAASITVTAIAMLALRPRRAARAARGGAR